MGRQLLKEVRSERKTCVMLLVWMHCRKCDDRMWIGHERENLFICGEMALCNEWDWSHLGMECFGSETGRCECVRHQPHCELR